jgi:hypothetical protein
MSQITDILAGELRQASVRGARSRAATHATMLRFDSHRSGL